jgi:hypothetical protein
MPKPIGYYLNEPVPPELEELEKNAHKLSLLGRSFLNEFVVANGAYEIYKNHQQDKNAYKRLAELMEPESDECLFEGMEADPLLAPILTLKMPALYWVQLQGWTREFLQEALRTSPTHVVATNK